MGHYQQRARPGDAPGRERPLLSRCPGNWSFRLWRWSSADLSIQCGHAAVPRNSRRCSGREQSQSDSTVQGSSPSSRCNPGSVCSSGQYGSTDGLHARRISSATRLWPARLQSRIQPKSRIQPTGLWSADARIRYASAADASATGRSGPLQVLYGLDEC